MQNSFITEQLFDKHQFYRTPLEGCLQRIKYMKVYWYSLHGNV